MAMTTRDQRDLTAAFALMAIIMVDGLDSMSKQEQVREAYEYADLMYREMERDIERLKLKED